jgi:hypothetical protein
MQRFVRLKYSLLLAAALMAISSNNLRAEEQPTIGVERIYHVDEKGDARVEVSFQLGARDWARWKTQFGDHPDILLRNLKYQMAAAVLDDYALEKNDVKRHAVAKVKARAVARYRGDGQFAVEVPKNMRMVSNAGGEWVFTSTEMDSGIIMNLTDRARLPSDARDVRLVNGNDYNHIIYSMPVKPHRSNQMLYLGGGLFGIGALAGIIGLVVPRRRSHPPALPPSTAMTTTV